MNSKTMQPSSTLRHLVTSSRAALLVSVLVFPFAKTAIAAEDPASVSQVLQAWRTLQDESKIVHYSMEGSVTVPAGTIEILDVETFGISGYAPKTDHEFDFAREVHIEPLNRRLKIAIESEWFSLSEKQFVELDVTQYCDGEFRSTDRGPQDQTSVMPVPRYDLFGDPDSLHVDDLHIDLAVLASRAHFMKGNYSFHDVGAQEWAESVALSVSPIEDSSLVAVTMQQSYGNLIGEQTLYCDPGHLYRPTFITSELDSKKVFEARIKYESGSGFPSRVDLQVYSLGKLTRKYQMKVFDFQSGSRLAFTDAVHPNDGDWCLDVRTNKVFQYKNEKASRWVWATLSLLFTACLGLLLVIRWRSRR